MLTPGAWYSCEKLVEVLDVPLDRGQIQNEEELHPDFIAELAQRERGMEHSRLVVHSLGYQLLDHPGPVARRLLIDEASSGFR